MPIDIFFDAVMNERVRVPTHVVLRAAPDPTSFQLRAFAALFHQASILGIQSISRCHAARMDGFLVTTGGETILLEMKESLGFGPMQSAVFEFITGRQLLNLGATRGLIVFERKSVEWERCRPNGAWGQLQLHSNELPQHLGLRIGGIQVASNGNLIGPNGPFHAS